MEHLQDQNQRLFSAFKFWRAFSLAVTLVSLTCIVSMAGTISGLRAAAEKADKDYRERIETETRLRDRAVREMAAMSFQLADMEREQASKQAETMAYAEAEESKEMEYLGEFIITAYCCEPYEHICGTGDGLTATGIEVTPGIVAVDPNIVPLGSTVIIDGTEYLAADTGGAIKGNKIDIAVELHSEALEFGRRTAQVWVVEP